jgi:hypothetical protein
MNATILIKCSCGKRFPISTWKHPNRRIIYCPFCRQPFKNSFWDKTFKPKPREQPTRRIDVSKIDIQRMIEALILLAHKKKEAQP